MCIIQKRTKDNSLTVFNPVEKVPETLRQTVDRIRATDIDWPADPIGEIMDNTFKDYVKDESPHADDLYFLENAVKDAEFYVNLVENNFKNRIPAKSIPKPLRKRIKKLGIDLK